MRSNLTLIGMTDLRDSTSAVSANGNVKCGTSVFSLKMSSPGFKILFQHSHIIFESKKKK